MVPDDLPAGVVAEAQRVATVAVATLVGPPDDRRLDLLVAREADTDSPRVVIVTDLGPGVEHPGAYLRTLADAVPGGLAVEIIAISDQEIQQVADEGRVEVRPRGAGGLAGLLDVGKRTGADVVVILEAPALPVGTCLASLVRSLTVDASTVAVSGCVVDVLGFLRSAGGVLLASGEVAGFGDPGADPFLPLYRFLRPVAVCPSPLVALRAGALAGVPPLADFGSAEAQYAALSLALRQRGGRLTYQPEATVVDGRHGPPVGPISPAEATRLRTAWPDAVAGSPSGLEGLTWYDVAGWALS